MSHTTEFRLDWEPTDRGFSYAAFHDRYGDLCSIQKSSLATEEAIWLGREGLREGARMHLTQEMVGALIPILQRFVESGELLDPDAREDQGTDGWQPGDPV